MNDTENKSSVTNYSNPSEVIAEGAQFQNQRKSSSHPPLRVIFEDDRTVVLEVNNKDRHRRYEPRDQFESGVGNQWEFIGFEKTEKNSESSQQRSSSQINQVISGLRQRIKSYQHDPNEPSPQIRKDTLDRIIAILEVVDNDEIYELELKSIDGVGKKTAENLREANLTTNIDILCASKEYLTEINGIGNQTAENLKSTVNAESLNDTEYYQ